MNIIIEEIELDSVLYYGKERYNSNNHWVNNEKPENYESELKNCETSKWIDKFHPNYTVINIFKPDICWIKEAYSIGNITRKFPSQFNDEKEKIVMKYNTGNIFENEEYFIRSDSVSLKHGMHGIGPYKSFDKIIESICTCKNGHSPIDKSTESIKLFLLPWIKFEYMNEFRVFVFQNRITGISQQNLYESNYILNKLTENDRKIQINKYIDIITKYFEEKIKKSIIHMESYTFDFIIKDDLSPYLVEFNPFGKDQASGSSLFHWIIDEDKLYNRENVIYFRYTI
jgi:hypothetical protein